jgi:sulfur-carrier protein
MMRVNILFFGALIDVTNGKSELRLSDVDDVNMVKKKLYHQFPGLTNYTFRIAVNQKILSSNQELSDNDVVALLPPFAGG